MSDIGEQIDEYSNHIVIAIFIIWYYTLDLMFLYRYAQTTNKLFLKRFLEKWWSFFIHIMILALINAFLLYTIVRAK
uniref:Uncharacterized protein n=1 Tax=Acrobeloides nanus TaxID=290746 RepID=A0A914CE76_9BILA